MNDKPLITDRELILDIHSKVSTLHNVVIGDRDNKNYGLVDKVHRLEKAEANRGRMYIFISSISAGLSIALHKAFEYFK